MKLNNILIGDNNPLVLIAGPCVVESKELTFYTAERAKNVTDKLGIPYIFKSSYKKANRTSLGSFTTLGIQESLEILGEVKEKFSLPVLTDVHTVEEIKFASAVADILQIPAFLCRQTDLLLAAGESGKIINIKKGQFLAPEDMKHAIDKVKSTGNSNIMLTERGTTFGYHNLVVDMRSLVIMRELGQPVVMDATHSVQMPSSTHKSGGRPEFIKPLAKAAAGVGIDALFLEVHPDPPNAKSDADSQLHLDELEGLLKDVLQIDKIVKNY
ncbi:MAG: 3-deoxy-8-phosphooctulonate synthase [Melioribacteraceae bacterium]|nr:3-deoxy-8-phosphooctulonate synthase [Melioribacteraceae bacterium]